MIGKKINKGTNTQRWEQQPSIYSSKVTLLKNNLNQAKVKNSDPNSCLSKSKKQKYLEKYYLSIE